jgi:hypothetical protein
VSFLGINKIDNLADGGLLQLDNSNDSWTIKGAKRAGPTPAVSFPK